MSDQSAAEQGYRLAEPKDDQTVSWPAHRWGVGAFLLVFGVLVLVAVVIGAIARTMMTDPAHSLAVTVIGTILPTVLAAGTALLVTRLRGNGPIIDLHWSMTREDLKAGLRFGAIGLVCTTVAAAVWAKLVGEQNATSAIGVLLDDRRMPIAVAVLLFLFVWLIGPLCEEIIYRGLLWGALERQQWGRWVVFALTTVIFAVSHLEPLRTSLLLVIGIPIGLARLYTDKLGASIIAHQVNNFVPAVALLLTAVGLTQP